MEDFLDQFLSSSSSWMDMSGVQASGMAGDSMGPFQETLKHATTPSDTLHRLVDSNTVAGSPVSLQLNTSVPVTRPGSTSQFLTAVVGPSRTAASLTELASAGSSSSEASGFQQALADPHPPAPVWSESYTVSAALPAAVGQGKVEGFTLKEEIVQGDGHILGKRSHSEDKMLARENRSGETEHDDLQGTLLTSYTGPQGGQTVLPRTPGAQSHQQNLSTQTIQSGEGTSLQQYGNHSAVSQLQSGAGGGNAANGAARPRVRARRGQATDPHSIAERLRRERIAERMKSLQELVPNSNKTDKASMLDEIIEYVKFLQLQVKVLSMSRLGGAGAVAPLIADVPSQGSGGVMSTALGQASGPLTLSQDGLAFEQEVARLMESNMTSAMQYLQNKGLCLMPIALATAISSSSGKPVLATVPGTGVDSSEKQNSDMQSIVLPFSSSSTTMGLRATASGSDAPINENSMNKASIEKVVAEKSNGISPGLSSDVPKVGSQSREELLKRAQ